MQGFHGNKYMKDPGEFDYNWIKHGQQKFSHKDFVAANVLNEQFKRGEMAENKTVETLFYQEKSVQNQQQSRDQ